MRIIIISPSVAEGEKIAHLYCSDEGWIAYSEKDIIEIYNEDKLLNSNPEDYQFVTEEQLVLEIPKLKDQLKEEDQKFITIDYENDRVYINPLHKTKSIFTDTSARATNQANFSADTWTYIKNKKEHYIKIGLISLLLLAASFFVSWGILILLFWILFYKYFATLAALDIYNIGTLNASIVITTKPTRIAVLTDMSMGFGKYPLVRVCKMKLPKKYNNLYQKIPSSCGYQNVADQPFWDYVMPNPIVNATTNESAIQQKIDEIPARDWTDLMKWIESNKQNYFEGYYPIKNDDSNWKEFENPIFISVDEEKRPDQNPV